MAEKTESGSGKVGEARVIPDDELWLHSADARERIDKALEWSARNPRTESDLRSLTREIRRFGKGSG